ncbi:MAG TPA: glutathione peroxidase [Tenuifilaceae bacterium]|nr:glutathione peroxidase [Tenuifilaceae bacterium]HPE18380.1 glutathione peroxidase [Tenuifilaceae bacterium]HRX68266.1 glutathione peroxidase [Tenuifilaceae bacterium]
MKKSILILSLVVASATMAMGQTKTLHDFTVTTLEGETFPLSQLKGKKVMVVNTASKCGLTPQYETLEKLYKQYGGEKFVIIGFPANNFMKQEPGTNSEIREFCTANYGVTFPMMEKISVKGDDIHPLYKWLTTKSENGVVDAEISWNFQKFLIDEEGNVVDYLKPREKPDSEKVLSWLAGK